MGSRSSTTRSRSGGGSPRWATRRGRSLFGRIDEEGGDRWYIGRRHVETEAGDEVVIEWRTPIAEPFYRAGPGDPLGLVRRRQLMVEHHRLVSFADDVFDDGAVEPGELRLRGGDALLAELERARTGEMLDIVATIQVEQDEVIRAPLPGRARGAGRPGLGQDRDRVAPRRVPPLQPP